VAGNELLHNCYHGNCPVREPPGRKPGKVTGTPHTILIGGICCIAGAFLFYKKLPELKKIAHPVYVKMGLIPEIVTGIQTASEPVVESVQLPVSRLLKGLLNKTDSPEQHIRIFSVKISDDKLCKVKNLITHLIF